MSTSFWLDRTNNTPSKSHQYDVTIVGAGISGLSIAYWLNKEDPSLKIAIVEKSRLGFGATGRNAGFITCGSVEHFNRMIAKHGEKEATDIWRFSEKNLHLLKEHIVQSKEEQEQIQFENKGCYSLAAQETEFKELQNVAEIMARLDIHVETIPGKDIPQKVGATGFVGGIKYMDDATTNPILLLQLLRSKVKADLFEQTTVISHEEHGGDRRLRTDNGNFDSPILIYALNGYLATAHPYFSNKVYPTRGQILMMEPVERFMEGPCYANFYLDYFRQMPTGELLIGGFRQIEKSTEVGYSDHITEGIQSALHQFVQTHLPQFKSKKVTHRWAGVMGFSADGQPLIGSLPDDGQVFFAGGYTAHGLGLAFHTGKCLADLIFGRDVPNWLSARRFS